MSKKKCRFPDGISIKPDGINELDPCVYETIETMEFSKAPIEVSLDRCVNCGYYEITWKVVKNEIDEN